MTEIRTQTADIRGYEQQTSAPGSFAMHARKLSYCQNRKRKLFTVPLKHFLISSSLPVHPSPVNKLSIHPASVSPSFLFPLLSPPSHNLFCCLSALNDSFPAVYYSPVYDSHTHGRHSKRRR